MRNLKISVFILSVFIFFIGCNTSDFVEKSSILKDKSKVQVVELDSLVIATINSDTVKTVSSIPKDLDTNLASKSEDDPFLDSLESAYKIYTEKSKIKLEEKNFILGKWLVEKRISENETKQGEQKVFVEYDNDSIFCMKAINVSGKWWISDTLLFQKFESISAFSVDTSLIHVLNDSVLEVSDIKKTHKFILMKVSE